MTTTATTRPKPAPPPFPRLLAAAQASRPMPFVPVVRWQGLTAVWEARAPSGVALLSFNQTLVVLHLHSGTEDAGATGWRYGPSIAGSEKRHLIAAFNGGFRLATGSGGFMSYGRTATPLRAGLGSIVTYRDGTSDIGTWRAGVPAHGRPIASVRQNLTLLVDHGVVSANTGCLTCWGATLGGVPDPARSALGITADRRLIWAGGEHLTVAALAQALMAAHVMRAVELDINPAWVDAYLYGHRGGHGPVAPVRVVLDQTGISGEYLSPWTRDFFTMVAR